MVLWLLIYCVVLPVMLLCVTVCYHITACYTEDNLRTLINCKIVQHLVLVLVQYKGQDIQMATLKLLALVISQGGHRIIAYSNIIRTHFRPP